MASITSAADWAIGILLSLIGWGWLLTALLRLPRVCHWGEYGAIGLAWTVTIGGVVACLGIMSPLLGVVYVLLGVLALVVMAWLQRRLVVSRWRKVFAALRRDRLFAALAILALALVALRFVLAIAPSSYIPLNPQFTGIRFNRHDDAHGYLVMLERFMQTGSIGPDPFNFRLMTTSLGGLLFVQGLFLSGGWRDHLRVADEGIGLVLLCGAALALAHRLSLPWRGRPLVVLLILAPLILTMNLTASLTTAALLVFIAGYAVSLRRLHAPSWRAGLVVGLVTAGLLALKTTIAPAAAFLLALIAMGILISSRRRLALPIFLTAGVLCVLLLLPWMICMHRMTGTPWYPVLGIGHEARTWGVIRDPITMGDWIRFAPALLPQFVVVTTIAVLAIWWRRARGWPLAVMAFSLLAWLATGFLLLAGMGSHNVWRYVQPLALFGSTTTAAVVLWAFSARRAGWRGWTRWAGVVCTGLVLAYHHSGIRLQATIVAPANLRSMRANQPVYAQADEQRAAMLQAMVPPGEPILARLRLPFLLDFRRNPIYVPDWPGMASPPPGMPVFDGPQALLDYLRLQRIRYVAYSYATGAGFDHRVVRAAIEAGAGPWDRLQCKSLLAVHENLQAIARTRRIIYDDGESIVFDLTEPSSTPPVAPPSQ